MTPGIVAIYVSGTSFRVAGDLTADFVAGVRVLADCGADGTPLGTVTSATYSAPNTTVTISLDGDGLTANLTHVWHGNDIPASLCNHATQHMLGGRDAIAPEDVGAMPADREINTTAPLWGGGTLWDDLTLGINTATTSATGVSELATSTEAVAGTDTARVTPVSAQRQAFLSWLRDEDGKFAGLPLPTFNFFAPTLALPDTASLARASSGYRTNPMGLLESETTNAARYDYAPLDGLIRGLRMEAAGTNNWLYSEKLSVIRALTLTSVSGAFQVGETVNGTTGSGVVASVDGSVLGLSSISGTFSGTVTGVTSGAAGTYSAIATVSVFQRSNVTTDAIVAPDGETTADKLYNDSTASSNHIMYKYCSFTTGLSYTFSIFVKAAEYSRIRLGFGFVGSPGVFLARTNAIFNTTSGVITPSADLTSYGIESVGNGWYRCWITAVCQASGTEACIITLDNGSVATYDGDNTSGVYIWGVQVEAGDVPRSYIQTANTAVTRAADVCTAALSGIDFNVSEGTLFVDAITPAGYSAFPKCISLYKDVNNAIYVDRQGSGVVRCVVTTGGTVVAQLNLGVVAHNTRFRAAFSWKADDFKASLNGGTPVTDTAGAIPTGFTTLAVGSTPATADANWNGTIRHLAYFPRALTSAQLRAITL